MLSCKARVGAVLVHGGRPDRQRAAERAHQLDDRLDRLLLSGGDGLNDRAGERDAGRHAEAVTERLPQSDRLRAEERGVSRLRVGLFTRPSVGVVVQALLDPETAGVMFTQNPVTGADERIIEASWGLGEAVVAGLVIPDNYRVDRSGEVLARTPGLKKIAVRTLPEGGTVEQPVAPELVERLCLDDGQLAQLSELADRCEQVYGRARDIEWAIADGTLYLLQCRAVTRAG